MLPRDKPPVQVVSRKLWRTWEWRHCCKNSLRLSSSDEAR